MQNGTGDIISARIIAVADDGRGIARTDDGFVIFIDKTLPGEKVVAKIYSKKSKFAEGSLITVDDKSIARTDAVCKYSGVCGGCRWQHISYGEQLNLKQQRITDLFERSDLSFPEFSKIIPSPSSLFYRNRLEYFFSDRGWVQKVEENNEWKPALGFHPANINNHVIDVDYCFLQSELSNYIRNFIYKYSIENNLSFYNRKTNEGLLRNMIIRTTLSEELMIIIIFSEENLQSFNLLKEISIKFPEITSLLFATSGSRFVDRYKIDYKLFSGKKYITEKLNNLSFKIGPLSFFQPNAVQAENLFKAAIDFAELNKENIVYDLYCGAGTLSCFAAKRAGKVIGIEYSPEAISLANENAELNNSGNVRFFEGDARNILTPAFVYNNGLADVVVADPPRAGMSPFVIHRILRMEPKKIIYISCNPSAQVRDLKLFAKKYRITKLQPFDMFPQTAHIENIAVLEKT